jgi:hypothetical protein
MLAPRKLGVSIFLTIQETSGMKICILIIIFLSFSFIMSMMIQKNQTQFSDTIHYEAKHESSSKVIAGYEKKAMPVPEGEQRISDLTNDVHLSAPKNPQQRIPTRNSALTTRSAQSELSSPNAPDHSALASTPLKGSKGMPVDQGIFSHSASDGALEISIPAQASLPAVLASGAVAMPSISPQAKTGAPTQSPNAAEPVVAVASIEKISENFFSDVTPLPGDAPVSLQEWEDASMEADERFRSLRGHDAYLRYKLEAAKESLSSLNNPQ